MNVSREMWFGSPAATQVTRKKSVLEFTAGARGTCHTFAFVGARGRRSVRKRCPIRASLRTMSLRRRELTAPVRGRKAVGWGTIGELPACWGIADVAFVGGRLDGKRGGQEHGSSPGPPRYGALWCWPACLEIRDTDAGWWNAKSHPGRTPECGGARRQFKAHCQAGSVSATF